MLSSTSTSLKHLTEMKSRKRRVRARFSALMRRLAPFLASEEADPSASGMSKRAQAAVLRDADGYIINRPSATLLGVFFFTVFSVSLCSVDFINENDNQICSSTPICNGRKVGGRDKIPRE